MLDLKLTYSPTASVDWNMAIRNTNRNGSQPWAGTFGFSNAVELAVPIDTRTTELGTAVEWTGRRGLARLGYDGSFFRNDIATLTWDNPLRIADSATAGPLQGRMALWPNSNMNTASATGAITLPARSRATAYLSVGNWSQNDPLIPFTVNSALPTPSLDRPTADVQARVTAMTYAFTSKPLNPLWISVRYRSYDFDNQTPIFRLANTVAYDTSVAAYAHGGTSPYSFTRRTFDADASFTPLSHAAFRAGYTREQLEPDVSVLRHDHRRHGAAVRRSHGSELADAARPLRARPTRRLGLRRTGARRHRRTGLAAAVRSLESQHRPGVGDRAGDAGVDVVHQRVAVGRQGKSVRERRSA